MSQRSKIMPLWEIPDFPHFLAFSLVSNLGGWMHAFSEQWVVLLLAGSKAASWAGRLSLASGIALLVCLPLGGSLADRFDHRKILRLTQGGLMVSALAVGVLASLPHGLTIHRLVGFAVFAGLGTALSMPASWGLLRRLVPREHFAEAYALFILQYDLSRMLGPSLAALVLPIFGIAGNFFINAFSYVGLFWLCWHLRPTPARTSSAPDRPREAGYGELFREVRTRAGLKSTLVLAACFGFLVWNQLALLPVYATRYLHFGSRGMASLMTALGMGALWASLWMARFGVRDHRKGVAVCFSLYGVLIFLWGAFPHPALAYGICLLIGPIQAMMWLLLNAQAQRLSPGHLAGRTTALFLTLSMGLMPIGNLLAGEAAQALGFQGPRWVLALDGLALLGVALGYRLHGRSPATGRGTRSWCREPPAAAPADEPRT